jgi:hypothetical protein
VLDEIFGEAWVNSTHRVLGKKLLPFSLWHRFQLSLLDSPVLNGQNIQPIDLERAVDACRLVYPDSVSIKIRLFSFRWRLAGRNFGIECQNFGAYMHDYFSIPKFLPSVKKYHQTEINHPPPEEIRIFSAISTMTGWTEEKIWMLPIGKAYWYAAGHWYQSGRELDFLTPEHLVLKERIEKMRQETSDAS